MVKLILEFLNAGLRGRGRTSLVDGGHLVDERGRQQVRILPGQTQNLLENEAVLLRLHATDLRHHELQGLLSFFLKKKTTKHLIIFS
jgi:hypothetical protein